MIPTQRVVRVLLATAAMTAGLYNAGCSSSSGSSPSPSPATPSAALTASFTTHCVTCHGADGSTKVGTGTTKAIKSTTLTEAQFKSAIRNGATGMTAYTATQMSDADITTNYTVLKK